MNLSDNLQVIEQIIINVQPLVDIEIYPTQPMIKQKELADKRLLTMEVIIGILSSIILFALIFVASFVEMAEWTRILLIIVGIVPFILGILYAIKIEQVAGYYECQKCHHKYIPTYSSVLFSMHYGRTRYMRCPKCNQKSWNKKVIIK